MIRLLRSAILALVLGVLPGAHLAKADNARTILVLDASGSMWGQIDGEAKITIARQALDEVLGALPPDRELGLIVYGHRQKGQCSDIELAVEPAAGQGNAIQSFAEGINPKGKTPLSASVRMAAEKLRYTEEKATVVLLTDGLETCDADPCALAKELEEAGIDFTAHVVGFGLSEEEGRQVACLAENTGGRYLAAGDAGQLADALTTTVAEAKPVEVEAEEPEPLEKNIRAVARLSPDSPAMEGVGAVRWDFHPLLDEGPASKATEGGYGGVFEASLPSGSYLARARVGRVEREVEFEAFADTLEEVEIVLDAGIVKVTPKRTADDAQADTSARVDVHFADTRDGGYGETTVYAPAGEIRIIGRIGKANVEETHSLAAGETLERDLVIGSGVVVPQAVYAPGGPQVEGSSIRFDVFEAKADINGNRAKLAGTYGVGGAIDVPPGDHVLVARLGKAEAEMPITVSAGERVEPSVVLNAGVLAISAAGAYRIDILEGKKDIQGRQKRVTGNYGDEMQETLHPGEYEVVVKYEGDRAEERRRATVAAGERAEVLVD